MPIFYVVVNKLFIGDSQKADFGETQPKVKHRYKSKKSLWVSVPLNDVAGDFISFFIINIA